ncbi:NAD binding domain of 6-phosphogluconate dehydrogenase-domain-containing protein [Dactylonectria estremocensis]|uniref:NAD binding domain of 6-phosphogluconate dehydrogenase-domain-containing protein n=1 Tax=Dactylonectria estremocensis TaxID=1079267 RepID=A0A9P9J9G1_9HYPO|nr:NAD binding domain of 6-phosphogluconate dehydrogenase-domain-containing protein [Dactylonectria estremocensis]
MAATKPPVAFIGLGAMGFGMATQLVKQGYPVSGFDVWPPTLERFQKAGGSTSSTPAEAVQGKDYCVCMVATAQQAQDVLLEGPSPAIPALAQGAVLLLCSTVACGYVQNLARQIKDSGRPDILLVDCPVSGGAIRAADGTLSIMAGAAEEAIAKGRDLLQAMSDPERLYIVSGGVGAGSNMKMCHQVLAANQILSASEAMGFAAHLGLDPAETSKTLIASEGWSWMLENRMPRMLHPEFQPVASAVTIILKDTSIITSEARRCGFPTPMTSAAEQGYFTALGRGFGPDDDASIIRVYAEGKGKVGPVVGLAATADAKLRLVVSLLKGIHVCAAAEALTFAHKVGLDLEQVFELCINAAGGSAMLKAFGGDMIKVLRGEPPATTDGLATLASELREAVDEAQRLKMPLFLGASALNILRLVLQHKPKDRPEAPMALAVKVWAA